MGIQLCVFNGNINRQIIFQYSKEINFERLDIDFLNSIDEYLPYLKKNRRLERLGLMKRIAQLSTENHEENYSFNSVQKIVDNITTQLKGITGELEIYEILSKLGFCATRANLVVKTFSDLNDFFCLPNITFEVVEINMVSLRDLFDANFNIIDVVR